VAIRFVNTVSGPGREEICLPSVTWPGRGGPERRYPIAIMDLSPRDSGAVQWLSSIGGPGILIWLSDGSTVLAGGSTSGVFLHRLGVEQSARLLIPPDQGLVNMFLSRDERSLYFVSRSGGGTSVFMIDLLTERRSIGARGRPRSMHPGISPHWITPCH
jgi:hypothetical protein